jgi:hypothetical protein
MTDEPFLNPDPNVDLTALIDAEHNALILAQHYTALGRMDQATKASDRAHWYAARAKELRQQMALEEDFNDD